MIGPAIPPSSRFRISTLPTWRGALEAPITATERGSNSWTRLRTLIASMISGCRPTTYTGADGIPDGPQLPVRDPAALAVVDQLRGRSRLRRRRTGTAARRILRGRRARRDAFRRHRRHRRMAAVQGTEPDPRRRSTGCDSRDAVERIR